MQFFFFFSHFLIKNQRQYICVSIWCYVFCKASETTGLLVFAVIYLFFLFKVLKTLFLKYFCVCSSIKDQRQYECISICVRLPARHQKLYNVISNFVFSFKGSQYKNVYLGLGFP